MVSPPTIDSQTIVLEEFICKTFNQCTISPLSFTPISFTFHVHALLIYVLFKDIQKIPRFNEKTGKYAVLKSFVVDIAHHRYFLQRDI
jgi:hypothetical protein